jgi:protease-4
MNISQDYLIERKRNKISLGRWKIFSLLLLIILIFVIGHKAGKTQFGMNDFFEEDAIARTVIEEVILDDYHRQNILEEIANDDKIKAFIVHINSPGGSTVGSEMLYNSFRKVAEKKPVVVVMGSVAASGGYMAALGGDYIIAHNGTLTGSIGVILQTAQITELADRLGVKFHNFKSNALKAAPNPTEELTPEATEAIMDNVYDVYDYFALLVAKRRNLDINYVRKIADGRIYSSQKALELKLIDAIGSEEEGIKWLRDKRNISKDLKIINIKLKSKPQFLDMFFDNLENLLPDLVLGKSQGFRSVF